MTRLNDSGVAESLNNKGFSLLAKGRSQDAIFILSEALKQSPYNPVILNNLGNAFMQTGNYPEAEKTYSLAILNCADYPRSYRNLGLLHFVQSHSEEAIFAYEKYLSLEPNDGEVLHNLALLYMVVGRQDEALALFQKAEPLISENNPESLTNLGIGFFYRGDHSRALKCFDDALTMNAQFVNARYYRGVVKLTQGELKEAICELNKVLDIAPDFPQAAANLNVAYKLAGEQPLVPS